MSKWEKVKLKNIAMRKLEYGSGSSATKYDGETRYIRITDINDIGGLSNVPVSPSTVDEKYKLNEGDLLFARSGATVGKTFLYHKEYGSCIYAGYLIRLVPNKKVVNPKYVFYFTKSPIYQAFVESNRRVVAQPNINAQQYAELKIPLPPLEIQEQIAKTLDTSAELLAMRKQQLAELDNLIKAVFYDMFGDPAINKKGWQIVKYSKILTEKPKNGFFVKNDVYSESGNCEVIWISDFIDKMYCDLSMLKKVNANEKDIKNYQVAYGDMLFCRSSLTKAGIGKCSYVPQEVRKNTLFECHIIKTRINLEMVNPIFLQVQTTTNYFRNQIITNSKTSTMTTISQEGIVKNNIILPPLELQNKFAETVTQIEAQKALVKQAIEETQYLFDSLMSKYFD